MKKTAASSSILRQRAEELLRKTRDDVRKMPLETVQELIYELQVHQVELQVQNEELRNIQRELEISRDKYHYLYDFAPIGYMTLSDSGIIMETNLMIGAQLGVAHHDLVGKKFTKFIKPAYQDVFYLHIRQLFHAGLRQTCELELIPHGDTKHLHVQLHSAATPDKSGCRIAVNDITAIKSLQSELTLACNQAKAANQSKSQFLANMSHELRTPLNAIVGLSHILRKSSPLTPKQKDYINTLQISADSLLALINELLDITRIEAGGIDLEHIPFQLPQLLNEALEIMAVKAKEKGLTIFLESDISHPYYYGDPLRLRQIVLNLLGNAVKFTEKGLITVRVQTTAHADDWRDIVIGVQDTGIGIPPEKIATIFETFTQADASTTRKHGGAGLGLTICKKLVEHMDGTISVVSQEGKGSVFTIHLPLQMASEAPFHILPQVPEATSMPPAAILPFCDPNHNPDGPCILLVEDHSPNVLIATTLLEEFHYNYDVAITGKDALKKLHERKYSLILLDIHMQDLDGFELLRIIREKEKSNNLQPVTVIAMTACAMKDDKEKCLNAGMNDYIPKPFHPEELRNKLEEYLPALVA